MCISKAPEQHPLLCQENLDLACSSSLTPVNQQPAWPGFCHSLMPTFWFIPCTHGAQQQAMVPLMSAGQQYGDMITQTGLFFTAKMTPDLWNQLKNKLTKAVAKAPGTSTFCFCDHCLGKLHREQIWKGFNKWGAAYSRAGNTMNAERQQTPSDAAAVTEPRLSAHCCESTAEGPPLPFITWMWRLWWSISFRENV